MRISINKSVLHKRRNQLNNYLKVLPALDLKRKQLTAELNRTDKQLDQSAERIAQTSREASKSNPMLAYTAIDLDNLVTVKGVQIKEKSLLGTQVPELQQIEFKVRDYGVLSKPHWVDAAVEQLQVLIRMDVEMRILQEKKARLQRAVKRAIQRVNLLDKLLIPKARADIKIIGVALADAERASVIRSKIAKSRLVQKRPGEGSGEWE
jgi:V/A-type H+-transporting ATPase subunit D